MDVRRGVLERTLAFGRLRWAAEVHDLDVDLKAIRVQRFVDIDTWTVDGEALMKAVMRESSTDDEAVVSQCMAALPVADPWRIAHGHDMLSILRIGLMRVLGDLPPSVGVAGIARVLRAAMSREELKKTALWAGMRAWEAENREYLILAD